MAAESQIRQWMQDTTLPQKRVTAGVIVIILLLAMTAVVVSPDDDNDDDFAFVETSPDVPVADPTFEPDSGFVEGPVEFGSPDTPVSATPATGFAGAPTPAAPSGGSAAAPSKPSSAAPAPAPTGDGGAPAPAPTTTAPQKPSVPLTASDRGVTKTEIKIGFFIINLAGIDGSGFALDIREDGEEYAQALGEWVNKRGGVSGRKINVVTRKTDPFSYSDGAAACRSMVDDHKVFGIVDQGGMSDPAAMECITVKGGTPFVFKTAFTQAWIDRSGGMQVSTAPTQERAAVTWVRDLDDHGWFDDPAVIGDEAKVVGVLSSNCPWGEGVEEGILTDELLAVPTVEKVVITKTDCTIEAYVSQPPAFVTQMRAEGVTHVLLAHSVASVVFMQTAESQAWKPKYTATDWSDLTADAVAANWPAAQADKMIGITALVYPKVNAGQAPFPGGEKCSEAAVEAGLEPFSYQSREAELFLLCSHFFLMLAGLDNAGPNPTRRGWAQAIPTIGQFASPGWGPSRFAPGKTSGGDSVVTATFLSECGCWKAITPSRPAKA